MRLWGLRPLLSIVAAQVVAGVGIQTQAIDCYSKYDKKPLINVRACNKTHVDEMREYLQSGRCISLTEYDMFVPQEKACGAVPVVCDTNSAAKLLQHHGAIVSKVNDDAGQYYRRSSGNIEAYQENTGNYHNLLGPPSFYQSWRDLKAQVARVEQAVKWAKDFVTLETVGESVEGRPIQAVRITGRGYKKGDPKLLLTFQMHAREWIAGMAGVHAVEKIGSEAKKHPEWLQGMEVVLIPMVNPDGFEHSSKFDRMWRKNRHPKAGNATSYYMMDCSGVDLNRNFPVDWNGLGSTSKSPCSEVYVGASAGSEPETKAVMKVVDEAPLTAHFDYHSYSELIMSPWGYTTERHPRSHEIRELMEVLQKGIRKRHSHEYTMGGSEILYTASGISPDYSTKQGAIGLTVEMSPKDGIASGGFLLNPSQIKPTAEDAVEGIFAAIEWIRKTSNKTNSSR